MFSFRIVEHICRLRGIVPEIVLGFAIGGWFINQNTGSRTCVTQVGWQDIVS